MSSRFLIPVLCIGAVAFACGPRAHNEASGPKKNDSSVAKAAKVAVSAPRHARKAERAEQKPGVAAELYVRASESNVRLAFHVVNTGKKRVELTFPSGQTYDFVVLDSVGREMWRWANGR